MRIPALPPPYTCTIPQRTVGKHAGALVGTEQLCLTTATPHEVHQVPPHEVHPPLTDAPGWDSLPSHWLLQVLPRGSPPDPPHGCSTPPPRDSPPPELQLPQVPPVGLTPRHRHSTAPPSPPPRETTSHSVPCPPRPLLL